MEIGTITLPAPGLATNVIGVVEHPCSCAVVADTFVNSNTDNPAIDAAVAVLVGLLVAETSDIRTKSLDVGVIVGYEFILDIC